MTGGMAAVDGEGDNRGRAYERWVAGYIGRWMGEVTEA